MTGRPYYEVPEVGDLLPPRFVGLESWVRMEENLFRERWGAFIEEHTPKGMRRDAGSE